MHLVFNGTFRRVRDTRRRTICTSSSWLVIGVLSVAPFGCGASSPTAPSSLRSGPGSLAASDVGSAPAAGASAPPAAQTTQESTAESANRAATTPEASAATEAGPLATPEPVPALVEFTIDPGSVISGDSAIGTLRLSRGAPAEGLVIALRNEASAIATVPATVTVRPGATTAQFDITTQGNHAGGARITATLHDVARSAVLGVMQSPPTDLDVLRTPDSVFSGSVSQGTVYLTFPANYFGVPIDLTSSSPAVTVPAQVVIPRKQTSVQFPISATVVKGGSPFPVVIEARIGSAVRTRTLQFIPEP